MEHVPPLTESGGTRSTEHLRHLLEQLREEARELEASLSAELAQVAPAYLDSARNLVHYLAVRRRDLRDTQDELAALGLSSLGRMEPHVLATVEAVLARLSPGPRPPSLAPVDFLTGPQRLREHTLDLFGPQRGGRASRIMVTMPTEAATRPELVEQLLQRGMDVLRINAAHDDPARWSAMLEHLERARRVTGKDCKVYADLAGPKLRTGATPSAGQVLKARPVRDRRGTVLSPAAVWFTPEEFPTEPPAETGATVVPTRGLLAALANVQAGDTLELEDLRGRKRRGRVVAKHGSGCLVEFTRTVYFESNLGARFRSRGALGPELRVGPLPDVTEGIELQVGDILWVERGLELGQAAVRDRNGRTLAPASIGCEIESGFEAVRPGESIWFDDGRIGGRILSVEPDRWRVEILDVPGRSARLQAQKGINLPDSQLEFPSLSEKDLHDLEFLAPRVDMVGLSFVRRPQDVLDLEAHLAELGQARLGVVLKIETRSAFEQLPRILLAGLCSPPVGVMIARGDLAVEVGFQRLAEVQEEILWLAEAAHVPVIWATQVLDGLAKTGRATRAEVSDVVLAHRAECVMLNKGPHVAAAVDFLCGIFERMDAHQSKKRARLRALGVASR